MAGLNASRQVDDQRDLGAMVVGVALAAPALRTEKIEGQAGVGSIVRREDQQGILTQSKLDQVSSIRPTQ